MDDLISRQAVLDVVNDCGICIQKILDIPSEDAVEVVRCKDCNWYDSSDELCLREGMVMDNGDFCSYGVRNDG